MTAAQLRLLRILRRQLVTNAVEQLDIALLWVLLHSRYEGPRHGSCGLCGDSSVGSVRWCQHVYCKDVLIKTPRPPRTAEPNVTRSPKLTPQP